LFSNTYLALSFINKSAGTSSHLISFHWFRLITGLLKTQIPLIMQQRKPFISR